MGVERAEPSLPGIPTQNSLISVECGTSRFVSLQTGFRSRKCLQVLMIPRMDFIFLLFPTRNLERCHISEKTERELLRCFVSLFLRHPCLISRAAIVTMFMDYRTYPTSTLAENEKSRSRFENCPCAANTSLSKGPCQFFFLSLF